MPIDACSEDMIVSNKDLLLTYCNRYDNRQFIARKGKHTELLSKAEHIVNQYLTAPNNELLSAGFMAAQLHLSPKYVSDCLKQVTGQTTQQFIHDKLTEHAKDLLSTTELSVSEIAYQLGFGYPQSLSKLFKAKTQQTQLEYRHSFN